MKKRFFIIPLLAVALASCNLFPQSSKEESKQKEETSFRFSSEDKTISSENAISSNDVPSSSNNTSSAYNSSSNNSSNYSSNNNSSSNYSSSNNSSSNNSSSNNSSSSNSSSSNSSSSSSSSSSSQEEDNIVNIELFALNDFHGNVKDSNTGLGISKTATLLKTYPTNVNNALYVSQGDMWQGSAESNMTRGQLVNDWMGQLGFTSMTLGNHEFDWNSSFVRTNAGLAAFPYLGINIFDKSTNQRVDYCDASVVVNKNGAKIGIIGAIGDCYSSISASMVPDIYFKVGDDLTNLVKNEAIRLKNEEQCDFIIYSLHEDDENYNIELSNYVDLVLEGHTHQNYVKTDSKGIYHIQSAGYNKTINYINIDINTTKDTFVVNRTKSIYTNDYTSLSKDEASEALFTKYADMINGSDDVVGYNSRYRNSTYLRQLVADLYLQYGIEKWGASYNIFLGGGYISCRTPYKLEAGDVTYAMLYNLFPFDNDLVLCTTTGYYLSKQFVNTSNDNYYISYTTYGSNNQSNINSNQTYYLITDTYSSDYEPNHLTVVDRYSSSGFYARDMLAAYISNGGLA